MNKKYEELKERLANEGVDIRLTHNVNYAITDDGRVWSMAFNKFLALYPTEKGYLRVNMSDGGKVKHYRVHRLVAEAFLPNPNKYDQINHKNENKADNRVENLEWCNSKYNNNYGSRSSRIGKKIWCRETGVIYETQTEAARALDIPVGAINRVARGKLKSTHGYHFVNVD